MPRVNEGRKGRIAAKADERIVANKQKIDAAAKKVVPINRKRASATRTAAYPRLAT